MRKVFLSFVGTTDYKECIYYNTEMESRPVRFVQEATIKHYCQTWSFADRIYIFATDEARKKNWVNDGHLEQNTNNILKRQGLETGILSLQLEPEVCMVPIPEGKDEKEIWDIFNLVYDSLEEGDSVVFDITHAFRSIPMLALAVLNYAKTLKNIRVEGIFYGAMEKLGPSWVVEKMPIEQRLVPVFDLTPFADLLDWTSAIRQFLQAGDAGAIKELTQRFVRPIKKASPEIRRDADSLIHLSKALDTFSENLATCRGPSISSSAVYLKQALEQCKGLTMLSPLVPLFEKISERINDFNGDDLEDGIRSARWCMEHNLLQQAYTILQETVIAILVKNTGYDHMDQKMRDRCASASTIIRQNLPLKEWIGAAASDTAATQKIIETIKEAGVSELLVNLSRARNDLNHSGYNHDACTAATFKKRLPDYLAEAEKLIHPDDIEESRG
ncbi:MAG: TIGR02221 family CRISPR-associated protein [Deltaproteobacteria bacterium CG_4_8_14_3_um_filter_51_11]|nr:MAG: TIGR02221 family CRISPR-associated protein [Deltaproteobacteria bacterium CG_4_8_14_3_um_filter_51_11]